MKYPPYISEYELKTTKKIFNLIRQTQDMNQAAIFKKLSLAAAYGAMSTYKINYSTFLKELLDYLKNKDNAWRVILKSNQPLIENFWGMKEEPGTVFNIHANFILYDTIDNTEKEIIKKLSTLDKDFIRKECEQFYNQLMDEYK